MTYHIKLSIKEVVFEDLTGIDLFAGRGQWRGLGNTKKELSVPQNVGNFLTSPSSCQLLNKYFAAW